MLLISYTINIHSGKRTHTSFYKTLNILSCRFTDFFFRGLFSHPCRFHVTFPLRSLGPLVTLSWISLFSRALAFSLCTFVEANSREKCRLFCSLHCVVTHATFLHIYTSHQPSSASASASRIFFPLFFVYLSFVFVWMAFIKENFRRSFFSGWAVRANVQQWKEFQK